MMANLSLYKAHGGRGKCFKYKLFGSGPSDSDSVNQEKAQNLQVMLTHMDQGSQRNPLFSPFFHLVSEIDPASH